MVGGVEQGWGGQSGQCGAPDGAGLVVVLLGEAGYHAAEGHRWWQRVLVVGGQDLAEHDW